MSLIDILLTRANINAAISKLELWNDKKANKDCQEMASNLEMALTHFDWLEKAYLKEKELVSYQKTIHQSQINRLESEAKELKEANKRLADGL